MPYFSLLLWMALCGFITSVICAVAAMPPAPSLATHARGHNIHAAINQHNRG